MADAYPAQVEEDGGEWIVTMRDLPGFIARGPTRRDAIRNGPPALQRVLAGLADPPKPSKTIRGEVLIGPAGLSATPTPSPEAYEPGRHVMVGPK